MRGSPATTRERTVCFSSLLTIANTSDLDGAASSSLHNAATACALTSPKRV